MQEAIKKRIPSEHLYLIAWYNLCTCRDVCNTIVLRWDENVRKTSLTDYTVSGNVINDNRRMKSPFRSLPIRLLHPGQGSRNYQTLRYVRWKDSQLAVYSTWEQGAGGRGRSLCNRHSTPPPPPASRSREGSDVCPLTSSLIRSEYEILRTTNSTFWLASQYESYRAVKDDTLVQGGLHNLAKMIVGGGRCSDAASISKRGFRHLLPERVGKMDFIFLINDIFWYIDKYINVST